MNGIKEKNAKEKSAATVYRGRRREYGRKQRREQRAGWNMPKRIFPNPIDGVTTPRTRSGGNFCYVCTQYLLACTKFLKH